MTTKHLSRRALVQRASAALAGAVAAPALVACGAAPDATPAAREANPALTLEYWHNKGGAEGQDVTQIVTRYNREFAPTTVNEIYQGNGAALLEKVKTAIVAGTPPDVIYGFGSWMPDFAEQGALVVAEDMIKRLGGAKKEDYLPQLVAALTWKGKFQALPFGTGSKGFYYRPDLFQKASLAAPPVTWEEFHAQARLLGNGEGALGFGSKDTSWFTLLLAQRSGDVLDAQGKAAFHDQRGIEALTDMVDLVKRGSGRVTANSAREFAEGQLAFIMSGEWQIRFYRADNVTHETALFPRPRAGDPPMTTLGADGFYMFKTQEPRQDATWRFTSWLVRPEIYLAWAVMGSFRLPISPATQRLPEYQRWLKENPQQKPFLDQLPRAYSTRPTPYSTELGNALGAAVEKGLLGQASPRDALRVAADQFNAAVK